MDTRARIAKLRINVPKSPKTTYRIKISAPPLQIDHNRNESWGSNGSNSTDNSVNSQKSVVASDFDESEFQRKGKTVNRFFAFKGKKLDQPIYSDYELRRQWEQFVARKLAKNPNAYYEYVDEDVKVTPKPVEDGVKVVTLYQ